ncbi:hypothetical protein [Nitrosomonas sp.]|uniref:hypothetical protein n=1 Tax=Nitrosomonas sp. TaxID=42353 RepID=UPI0025DF6EC1|nr:hypothetical protein [Nitrosomonas sp.]MCC6915967.1 hypothetical protein [Nitrosomonas sp.]
MKIFPLDSSARTSAIKWSESIVLPFSFIAIGYLIDPLDPLFLQNHFPWLIVAPVLICLRYGFLYGLVTTSLIISSITFALYLKWPQPFDFPKETVLGLVIIAFISSEFYEFWNRKITAIKYEFNYIKTRMENFSRSYNLIKSSHYYLEQHLASQTKSLRLTLSDLERKIFSLTANKEESLPDIGLNILRIFSDYANVQAASLYMTDPEKKLIPQPVAYIGGDSLIASPDDPVIKEALKLGFSTILFSSIRAILSSRKFI